MDCLLRDRSSGASRVEELNLARSKVEPGDDNYFLRNLLTAWIDIARLLGKVLVLSPPKFVFLLLISATAPAAKCIISDILPLGALNGERFLELEKE